MSVALLDHCSFLSGPIPSNSKSQRRTVPVFAKHGFIFCNHSPDDNNNDSSRKNENQLAKMALVAMTAGVLALGSVDPAAAGKTGGRVGGQSFRSSAPQAPRSSGPRINNSRTNVYINPRVAPPLGGGYGYGYGYGGWGWSPFSFFAPAGPSVAVGVGGGFDLIFLFIVFGAVSAVVRRFLGSREDEEDDDY